ncbi:peroxisome assembly protein 26 isoform X2 [Gadus chalcogrammus]|uniref:peroxisome assembly protein 26 isoform X2 n=1 Tax=Gadus chalcogrammus TaxID=1042646 RepID=UPI0024C4A99D|nr:peroxisome assembly protein 26 isoform X2 [Gadus chalcogrammus]
MAEEAMRSDALTSPAEQRSCSPGGSQVPPRWVQSPSLGPGGTEVPRRWVQSPPLGSGGTQMGMELLDAAAEQFIVHRDFQTSFGLCEKGLALLEDNEQEHSRGAEVKEGLCILGVQALAELDQWPAALPWVLRQYERPEEIPAQIMQMCILLYSKVGQEAAVQEAAGAWLLCPAGAGPGPYRTVAELYLLCVLLPLGRTDDARRLVLGEVGGRAFSEDQRQLALEVVTEKEAQGQETPDGSRRSPSQGVPVPASPPGGALMDKLRAMLRLLCRSLSLSRAGWVPLRRLFMALVIVYILVVRMNPALPSSYLWISKLIQLLKQMWSVMFKQQYSA